MRLKNFFFALAFMIMPMLVFAQTYTTADAGGDTSIKWLCTVNDDGITVTITGIDPSGTQAVGEFVIPSRLTDGTNTYTVTSIVGSYGSQGNGIEGNTGINELSLPMTLTSIGDYTFNGCDGFTGNLNLPSSLTYIGDGAFEGCGFTNENIVIPSTVTFIGQGAFEGCTGLRGDLNLSELSLNIISTRAFRGCANLDGNLSLPSQGTLTFIDDEAFKDCGFTNHNLTLPFTAAPLDTLVYDSFEGCTGLTGDIIVPEGVQNLTNAFEGCSNLNSITYLSKALELREDNAFSGCSSLTMIDMSAATSSEGLETLSRVEFDGYYDDGAATFGGLPSTTTVKLPQDLTPASIPLYDPADDNGSYIWYPYTNGIKGVTTVGDGTQTPAAIYMLDGRYVGTDMNALAKGVYIVNGKKVTK